MRLVKYKNAIIPYKGKENKNKRVYGLNRHIADNTGKNYQLFCQDDLSYVVDIRVNNPKVGLIVNGLFFACCKFETLRDKFDEISNKINNINLVDEANKILSKD